MPLDDMAVLMDRDKVLDMTIREIGQVLRDAGAERWAMGFGDGNGNVLAGAAVFRGPATQGLLLRLEEYKR